VSLALHITVEGVLGLQGPVLYITYALFCS
jgi:hypothetical protein